MPLQHVKAISQSARFAIGNFLQLESAGGLLLIGAAILALVVANLPVADFYFDVLDTHLTITLGGFGVDKPLALWINDGLMAVFFLLVGLELKREILEGQLSSADQLVLPVAAAAGGMACPALIFWLVNHGDSVAMNGWAIPTATDIAFALAVLKLLGDRVPVALKLFLTTVAIIDDLGAIVIIALFYSDSLSPGALVAAAAGIAALFVLNRFGVQRLAAYLLVGSFIWLCVLKSGVHATLAGIVVAFFIPLKADDDHSPARHLEHTLHPWVAFGILPLFAFANAGVALAGTGMAALGSKVSLGISLGLLLGKPIGVFGLAGLALLTGLARKPEGTTLGQLFGVALCCGVGFTMSLFIGSLAFEYGNFVLDASVKLGVIGGSVLSAVLGWLVLRLTLPGPDSPSPVHAVEPGNRKSAD